MVSFIEVYKYFWSLEAINYCVTYFIFWIIAEFQLEISEN